MTRKQREKSKMYLMVQDFLSENQTIWGSVPRFVDAVQLFNTKLEQIRINSEQQSSFTVGVLPQRNKFKSDTLIIAFQVRLALRALAVDLEDMEMYVKMKGSRSSMFKGSNMEILLRIDIILNMTSEHANQLSEYGITTEILEDLQSRRNELTVGIFSPGKAIIKRKDMSSILSNHFKETDKLLKDKIDGLVEIFRISQPEFYNSFQNVRKVVHVVYHTKDGTEDSFGEEQNEGEI